MVTTYALEEFLQLNLTVKHYESTGQTSGLPVFELIAHLALAAGDPHRYAPHSRSKHYMDDINECSHCTSVERTEHLRHGRKLEYFTIGWNMVEAGVAIGAGWFGCHMTPGRD